MDLSRELSQDEARILQRPLYRPGQTPPASKSPPPGGRSPSTNLTARPAPTRTVVKRTLPGQSAKPSRWKRLRLGLIAILVLLGLVGIAYCLFRPDPVAQIKADFAALREKEKNMTPQQRREAFKGIRDKMKDLTPQQRNELGKERRQKEREKMERFFKLPKKEQIAELKKDIKESEARRARFLAERAANGGNGGGGPGGPGGGGRGGGGGPPGGGWGRRSPEQRDLMMRNRLDSSTPEDRAMRSTYFSMMRNLRQQMGLPSFGPGGFGGPPRR